MKKSAVIVIAALLIVCCMAGFTACSKKSDWEYIGDKGTLVVGVTDYKPMDYQNGDGSWTGFDAEAARLVGAALGLKVEFIEISWDEKITELKSKKIDVIWNGMTVTDELKENMDFSYSYAQNSQVAVIKKSDAAIYTSIETIKNAGRENSRRKRFRGRNRGQRKLFERQYRFRGFAGERFARNKRGHFKGRFYRLHNGEQPLRRGFVLRPYGY
jgi:ABC-type amino acid transport substrate-binding protein